MPRDDSERTREIRDKITVKAPNGATSDSIFVETVTKAIEELIKNGYIEDIHRDK